MRAETRAALAVDRVETLALDGGDETDRARKGARGDDLSQAELRLEQEGAGHRGNRVYQFELGIDGLLVADLGAVVGQHVLERDEMIEREDDEEAVAGRDALQTAHLAGVERGHRALKAGGRG